MKRIFVFVLAGATAVMAVSSGTRAAPVSSFSAEPAVQWMELIQELVKEERLSPPIASRIYGYTGVALYEALLPGMPDFNSLAGQLNELPAMPPARLRGAPPSPQAWSFYRSLVVFLAWSTRNPQRTVEFDWPTVAAVTAYHSAYYQFPSLAVASQKKLAGLLLLHLYQRAQAGVSLRSFQASIFRGVEIAQSVAQWAATDGWHETRGIPFQVPVGPGLWVPTGPVTNPLEPYWGTLRPFALPAPDACAPPPPVEYSEEAGSEMYEEAMAVFEAVNNLDDEAKTIALFWADNPGQTPTPPGHWISVAGQLLRGRDLNLENAVEAYALVGISVADAFISCWEAKYVHNLLRPVTYIRDLIDPGWQTFIPTPPFPEYTSGHSVNSGAAAVTLTRLFGDGPFTDDTHHALGYPAREFDSFYAAAEEAAISRLYGGIHYPMGIDEGVPQGYCVGGFVSDLVTRRD
jgi:hypothetical protein